MFPWTMKGKLNKLFSVLNRNQIEIDILSETLDISSCSSKIGGMPSCPRNFVWPTYKITKKGETKNLPLAFLAQFNLKEISKYDTEGLLPKTGILSFFYELEEMKWGFSPEDKGCARVFYFEDENNLVTCAFPQELPKDFQIPELALNFKSKKSLPYWEEYDLYDNSVQYESEFYDEIKAKKLGAEESDFKILGYADVIQDTMPMDCELVNRGFDLGNGPAKITDQEKSEVNKACKDWILLFQMGSITTDDYELMFGDCGKIYFYIRKDDLASNNFDNIWLVLQCF